MALVTRTAATSNLNTEINATDATTDVLYLPVSHSPYDGHAIVSTVTRTKKLLIMPEPGARLGDVLIDNANATTLVEALNVQNANKLEFVNLQMKDLRNGGGSSSIRGGGIVFINCVDCAAVNCRVINAGVYGGCRNITFDRCDIGGVGSASGQLGLVDLGFYIYGHAYSGDKLNSNIRLLNTVIHDLTSRDSSAVGSPSGDGDQLRFYEVDGFYTTNTEVKGQTWDGSTGHPDIISWFGGAGNDPVVRNMYFDGFFAHDCAGEGFIASIGQMYNIHYTNCIFNNLTLNSSHLGAQDCVGVYVFNCSSTGDFSWGGNNSPNADHRVEEVYIVNCAMVNNFKNTTPGTSSPLITYADHNVISGIDYFGTSTNTITTAPTYVNTGTNVSNLHTQAGSSTIGAGVSSAYGFSMPKKDRDGKTRNATPDIGAYEH